jgi:hypothetical protein
MTSDPVQEIGKIAVIETLLLEYIDSHEHRGTGVHRDPDSVLRELVEAVSDLRSESRKLAAAAEHEVRGPR